MGWEDDHLHEFCVGQRRFGPPEPGDFMGMSSAEDERKAPLFSVLGRVGAKARYTYDFGDSWEHSIIVEKRLTADPNTAYPVCTGGKLAGPRRIVEGSRDFTICWMRSATPVHDQHEESRDWLGDEFDPKAFSVDDVNRRLAFFHRRRGKASGS